MNEITITRSDWSKDEQEFADVIIKICVSKYKYYEQQYTVLPSEIQTTL